MLTLLCHARLAEARPPADRLTEYYLLMSLGGVIGGALVALVAPTMFNDIYEYPILIVAAGLVLPYSQLGLTRWKKEWIIAGGIVFAAWLTVSIAPRLGGSFKGFVMLWTACVLIGLIFVERKKPSRLGASLLGIWILVYNVETIFESATKVILQERSFFGAFTVQLEPSEYGDVHTLTHGNSIHNFELRTDNGAGHPLAYFAPEGPFGQVISSLRATRGALEVGIIGLGAGALACHAKPDEQWVFYEIDPLIVDMAKNPAYFSYMEHCRVERDVKLGDARLNLQNSPDDQFDLIVIDAFSSNSIPAHLLTIEAVNVYQSKLKDNGVLFFHTSNQSLDVSAVVVNLAYEMGLSHQRVFYQKDSQAEFPRLVKTSEGILVGYKEDVDLVSSENPHWSTLGFNASVGVWTDDYSHILGALISKQRNR